jgi:hypothetical protein
MNAVTTKKSADLNLITSSQMKEYESLTSIAAKIRFLHGLKKSKGDISRFMTEKEGKLVRYQWVRNVLNQPLKNG